MATPILPGGAKTCCLGKFCNSCVYDATEAVAPGAGKRVVGGADCGHTDENAISSSAFVMLLLLLSGGNTALKSSL